MRPDTRQLAFDQLIDAFVPKPVAPAPTGNNAERTALYHRFADKLVVNTELSRSVVSFQANKTIPFCRWFKYREGFSYELVRFFLHNFQAKSSPIRVLDPFAGAGTTLITAAQEGCQATGIELLPVGTAAIRARLLADTVNIQSFQKHLKRLENFPPDATSSKGYRFTHIRITQNAFPEKTEQAISAYIAFLESICNADVRYLFWFACFSILEDVSYTRKDGQYLRWDNRSGRKLKATFDKGPIHELKPTVIRKLHIMLQDIKQRNGGTFSRNVNLIEGSSLTELAKLPSASFDLVVTSPPYCNRYDYTRTYALELAFLGCGEEDVKDLRQTLLSATVENKTKKRWLDKEYRSRNQEDRFKAAVDAFNNQRALQEILKLLYAARDRNELNNNNIPNLVENYFFEMSFVIQELARIIASGGRIVMVNDNVQYVGEEVPVDLILSDFAACAGLVVDKIWVLPKGKGNSSQQMGAHGRNELRKCVYVWSKPKAVGGGSCQGVTCGYKEGKKHIMMVSYNEPKRSLRPTRSNSGGPIVVTGVRPMA